MTKPLRRKKYNFRVLCSLTIFKVISVLFLFSFLALCLPVCLYVSFSWLFVCLLSGPLRRFRDPFDLPERNVQRNPGLLVENRISSTMNWVSKKSCPVYFIQLYRNGKDIQKESIYIRLFCIG